ncbi:universal stress protein PHOS34-like [Phalaenopsis equestris]|uniref:universal stress protein PHOS34-like n=1 Tax=Phalaenopsis equestris TaxID=78828 RepID=UPI0009E216AB|nr:universal stress protein PHOS34-like [Phalaenopsis equestris]
MATAAAEAAGESKRGTIVLGFDDSEHSFYALEWILSHFFASGGSASIPGPAYNLVIIHAKPNPTSLIAIGGPVMSAGAGNALPILESDLKIIAARVIEKAREFCIANSVSDVKLEVVEGDARYVLCEAVDKFNADVLVVGSHGYGAIKRVVLGSVSDYCAHHAHCTVMIVKKPKHKNKH